MTERSENIIASNARVLVSIHCNSIGYASDPENVVGTGTFYRYVGFQPLATIMMGGIERLAGDDLSFKSGGRNAPAR